MEKPDGFLAALREHKRWADAGSIISIMLVVGLLSVATYLADSAKVDEGTRIGMYIAMVAVIIVVCIWQAAACVAASIDSSLHRRGKPKPWE